MGECTRKFKHNTSYNYLLSNMLTYKASSGKLIEILQSLKTALKENGERNLNRYNKIEHKIQQLNCENVREESNSTSYNCLLCNMSTCRRQARSGKIIEILQSLICIAGCVTHRPFSSVQQSTTEDWNRDISLFTNCWGKLNHACFSHSPLFQED